MKKILAFTFIILASKAFANDHNNLEHGRPLLFDDAYSIAYGEREIQVGFDLNSRNLGLMTSFGYGFAKNQELSFSFETRKGSSTVSELSYLRNLIREIDNNPALGYRVTLGSDRSTLRLIATKAIRQYDKVHLNLDLNTNESPGIILGYSNPLGYPKKFDQTLVSELGFSRSEASMGLGIRKQIDARSILDIGIKSGRKLQLILGYSLVF